MAEITRRKFIQLTVIGAAAAGLAGCESTHPQLTGTYGGSADKGEPYVNQPPGAYDGVPQYFATTCRMCPAGCGIMVRTFGGRAVKIEGNPAHPVSAGKTCARGQAALQHLYNPDRVRHPKVRSGDNVADASWEDALTRTATALASARGRIAVLADRMETSTSPAFSALLAAFAAAVGGTVYDFSLLDDRPWLEAARAVYGRAQIPAYRLDAADVIVSFSANFLEAWPSNVYYNRLFGEFRQGPRRRPGDHGRFIYVGPRMSQTAAKADDWLPCAAGSEGLVASAVQGLLGGRGIPLADAAAQSGLAADQITALADTLRAAGPRAVAVAGDGLLGYPDATAQFAAVDGINPRIASACVGFGAPPPQPRFGPIDRLATRIAGGGVSALLVVGRPNPLYALPSEAPFAEALPRVPFIAAIAPFADETSASAHVVLPSRTFLEEWSDAVPLVVPPGMSVASPVQPIVDPAYIVTAEHGSVGPWMDTRPAADILIDLARRAGRALPSANGQAFIASRWPNLQAALADGGRWSAGAAASPAAGTAAAPARPASPVSARRPLGEGGFVLLLYPHVFWTDGRHANLPWLQEIPDPMSSAVWNGWTEINLQVAEKLGIRTGDIVRISGPSGTIELPALPYPAIHPDVVAVPIGQGHALVSGATAARGANGLQVVAPAMDPASGAFVYNENTVSVTKIRSARPGYDRSLNTLVLVQDRPGGQEPEAVKGLIHETARERLLGGRA